MEHDKSFLGKEPVGKLMWKLAIPTVLAQFVNILYNIVDRIYIGHISQEGSLALTGLGVCVPVITIVSAFAALVSTGGAPRASIFMGSDDMDSAEKALGGCFTVQIVISAILTAVLLMWNRPILLLFGASENTIGYALDYMNIYAAGTVFVQLTLGMNAFITAQGFARTGMLTVMIGAVINILLDPLLIFTCGMGVKGAAIATIISQGISCVWVLAFITGKKTVLRLKAENLFSNPRLVLSCLTLGLAAFIMQGSEGIILVCYNASLLRYGGDTAVGAMTIMSSVMQFNIMPMQGIAQGAQPISSYNFGAGNSKRVRETLRLLLKACLTCSVVVWILVMLFPQLFATAFSPNPELIAFTSGAMRIYCAAMLLMGIQMACQMTFVSIGNAGCSIAVAVVRKFVLLIPLIYVIPHLVSNKTMGVYMAEPIADVIAVAFTAILFTIQFKIAMQKLDAAAKSQIRLEEQDLIIN